MVWNIPERGSPEMSTLDLVTDLLSQGKNSRLFKRLVYEDQIATDVSSYVLPGEIGGQLYIVATAQPGGDLKKVEAVIREELDKLLKNGPTESELDRIKTQYRARFVRGIERIGGFGGKSDILARNQIYAGSPDFYKTLLKRARRGDAREYAQGRSRVAVRRCVHSRSSPLPQVSAQA